MFTINCYAWTFRATRFFLQKLSGHSMACKISQMFEEQEINRQSVRVQEKTIFSQSDLEDSPSAPASEKMGINFHE